MLVICHGLSYTLCTVAHLTLRTTPWLSTIILLFTWVRNRLPCPELPVQEPGVKPGLLMSQPAFLATVFSPPRRPRHQHAPLLLETVATNLTDTCSCLLPPGMCVSRSIISGCLSDLLKGCTVLHMSREAFVYCRSLHIFRRASPLIKKHYICPYLLCPVNQRAENSSQESVFVVDCHGTWARILDAPRSRGPMYHSARQVLLSLVTWRPGQLKRKNLFPKRQKVLNKISQGDPTRCRDLKNLL